MHESDCFMTNKIEIKNFKSIRHIVLGDCRRINLLIGNPNVGKSNLLEAMAAFNLPYARYSNNKGLQQFIRCENETELFFNGNTEHAIEISTDTDEFVISQNKTSLTVQLDGFLNGKPVVELSGLKIKQLSIDSSVKLNKDVKSYFFSSPFVFENTALKFLQPCNGCNLSNVLNSLSDVKAEIAEILQTYGLKLTYDNASREIKFLKDIGKDNIYLVPFNSMADTLQRIVFYKTAIASNQHSIITFEEPEAHAYPPYISKITTDITHSETNQFFITTHSPYVLTDFLENSNSDIAIYLVDYKHGETRVKRMTDAELNEAYNFGVDLFFNHQMFLVDKNEEFTID